MNDQPTTTAQAEASEPVGAVERPPAEETTERATGTRELRDAQARKVQGERPPIRAEGTGAQPAQADAPLFDEAAGQQLRERWVTI